MRSPRVRRTDTAGDIAVVGRLAEEDLQVVSHGPAVAATSPSAGATILLSRVRSAR
jgi:hypothetical protein